MNNRDGSMNIVLRRIALVMGVILLLISIYWSQDGFNFEVAGDSGGTDLAVFFGYALAIAVTVIQFVFSTNLRELNASLVVFGLIAYAYSIYTNYQGIVHFQGSSQNEAMAAILGFAMDGVPEPLIAWGLKDSLSGDFVGNIFKGIGLFFTGKSGNGQQQYSQQTNQQNQQRSKSNNQHNQQGRRPEGRTNPQVQSFMEAHRVGGNNHSETMSEDELKRRIERLRNNGK